MSVTNEPKLSLSSARLITKPGSQAEPHAAQFAALGLRSPKIKCPITSPKSSITLFNFNFSFSTDGFNNEANQIQQKSGHGIPRLAPQSHETHPAKPPVRLHNHAHVH